MSTGRDSSVAAAKTTWLIPCRRASISTLVAIPSSTLGMGGKSLASTPLIRASKRAHFSSRVLVRGDRLISILSLGRELINSVRSRAGTVIVPSSSTLAPIQQLIAISRLVATSLRRDWSVAKRMLLVMGRVVLVATALPTRLSPRFKFSCRHDSFMVITP